ncbi:Uncharacterised protein [Bordetella pertussis]|nr:Uncharacterised protein [Bordetella pertussis]
MTIQPAGVSSRKVSRYSGSPVSTLTTGRSLNRPRVVPSRTNLVTSAANSTLKIASGLESASACTTLPASTLPSGAACSETNSMSGWPAFIRVLKVATAD